MLYKNMQSHIGGAELPPRRYKNAQNHMRKPSNISRARGGLDEHPPLKRHKSRNGRGIEQINESQTHYTGQGEAQSHARHKGVKQPTMGEALTHNSGGKDSALHVLSRSAKKHLLNPGDQQNTCANFGHGKADCISRVIEHQLKHEEP